MTFDDLWSQLARKRPALDNPDATVEFTADNLRKLLRQVYEQGRGSAPSVSPAKMDAFSDIFTGGLFK